MTLSLSAFHSNRNLSLIAAHTSRMMSLRFMSLLLLLLITKKCTYHLRSHHSSHRRAQPRSSPLSSLPQGMLLRLLMIRHNPHMNLRSLHTSPLSLHTSPLSPHISRPSLQRCSSNLRLTRSEVGTCASSSVKVSTCPKVYQAHHQLTVALNAVRASLVST